MLIDLGPSARFPREAGRAIPSLKGALLGVDAPEWEAVLRASRHDFYHLPPYVALSAFQLEGRARALYVTDDVRTLLLPLVVRDIPDGGTDATTPYGYPGPVGTGTEDPEFLSVALLAGLRVLREAGLVSAFVRLHPLLNPLPPQGVGALVQHGVTVSIDLTLPADQLWAQTRPGHRHDITRALRLGYVARMDEEWRHLESFVDLYRATMVRRHAAPFYLFEDAYFEGLRDALGGSLHLCVVEKDGVIAAAGLFAETGGIVEYHLSGTDPSFRIAQPTKLMLSHVRDWAKARGNEAFHLGGGVGGDSDSLLQFKAGFSPLRHAFHTLRVAIDEREYCRLVTARDPLLDPDERSGYFPLYRQA
jgi:hypothetical protein